VFVTVTVYVLVAVGLAVGFETVVDDKPVVGDQLYISPAIEATPMPMPVGFWVQVFVKSAPALATGIAVFTVTNTWSVAVHPLVVFVDVKV
jgi:hypothetical protein